MQIAEFLKREKRFYSDEEIHDENGDPIIIQCFRRRDSNGDNGITLFAGGQQIQFTTDFFGHEYEMAIEAAIEVLEAARLDPCLLPKEK